MNIAKLLAAVWMLIGLPLSALAAVLTSNAALVVIDMQPEFVIRGRNHNEPENVKKVNQILKVQAEAIQAAQRENLPIVFLEYTGFGETNHVLKKAVGKYKNVAFIKKNTDGMFEARNKYRDELVNFLSDRNIKSLIITGANGGACVHSSISGALENEYRVIALTDGIADFNFKEFVYPYRYNFGVREFGVSCNTCTFKEVQGVGDVFLPDTGSPRNGAEGNCIQPGETVSVPTEVDDITRALLSP